MDEFKPEDELKPDTSDRRPQRQPRSQRLSAPQLALSRQHLMIGIGIVVLVLLVIAVGSALQSPSQPSTIAPKVSGNAEKNIDLSSSSSMTQTAPALGTDLPATGSASAQPHTVNVPPISDTPTQAQVTPPPAGQQRVELPGSMTDALSSQQDKVNAFSQGAVSQGSNQGTTPTTTLPTAPATVAPAAKTPPRVGDKTSHDKAAQGKSALTSAQKVPMTSGKLNSAGEKSGGAGTSGSIQNAPASHFTLQLSSASRSETLKAYAKQHNLPNTWVYETKRDGKPWYVLVSGVYASSAEAKQAVSLLPADIRAQKPWVKPIRQVKQDVNK